MIVGHVWDRRGHEASPSARLLTFPSNASDVFCKFDSFFLFTSVPGVAQSNAVATAACKKRHYYWANSRARPDIYGTEIRERGDERV